MRKTSMLLAVVLAGASAGAVAQSDPALLRSRLMDAMWQEGLSTLNRMGRGQQPYNKEAAERALARITEIAAQLPPLWPPGSTVSNPASRYASSPKVWETKADFDARLAQLPTVVAENRAKAGAGAEGARDAFQAVNTYCDSCHDVYRIRVR